MVFNSLTFLVFFAVVLGLHSLPTPWRLRKLQLLIASYVFYAAWNPPFVALLWLSTLVDWFAARRLHRAEGHRRRLWLGVSLAVNLGLLGFFKYGDFLLDSFVDVLDATGVKYQPPRLDLFLPVGISFYTFQTLSYTLDVYHRRLRPWPSFLDFSLFVSFFPQLVAGPIVRAVDFLPQCETPRRADRDGLGYGLGLLALGLFEKVVLADTILAPVVDRVYGNADLAGFTDAWLGTFAFAGQIFFDFAGYSTCAIGAALALGFALPRNFHFPYAAVGLSDFWRRWHVSLSSWLRDYLYIPLGGNRHGPGRTRFNLLLTMLLGGLWHGASWRFLVWGGLHGVYLIVERGLWRLFGGRAWIRRPPVRVLLALLTFLLVCLTWVLFRASDFATAFTLLRTMLTGGTDRLTLGTAASRMVLVVTAGMLAAHWCFRNASLEDLVRRTPWWLRSVLLTAMLVALCMAPGDERAFLYFQF